MKTNARLTLTAPLLLIISFFLPQNLLAQNNFDFEDNQQVIVMIQFKTYNISEIDSSMRVYGNSLLVSSINEMNEKMGYANMEKKVAMFDLETDKTFTPYMSIRKFEDIRSAAEYVEKMKKLSDISFYGGIPEPFPISKKNYLLCMEAKDFYAYYKLYKLSQEQG